LPGIRISPAPLLLALAVSALLVPACTAPVTQPPGRQVMSWRVASAHLEDLFAEVPNSSIDDFRKETPAEERLKVNSAHGEAGLKEGKAHIYGEPTAETTDHLLRRMGLGGGDVLYDLGCGRAFFLMQALLTTPLRRAVGVELAASRVDIARTVRRKLLDRNLLQAGQDLELREEDIARTDLADATVVFMDSVFFSDELLANVARAMSRARNLRSVVMIMKGLPPNPWFELEGTERLKMSWSPKFGSDVLFYKRTSVPAEPAGPVAAWRRQSVGEARHAQSSRNRPARDAAGLPRPGGDGA
jgi:hypothetical protein